MPESLTPLAEAVAKLANLDWNFLLGTPLRVLIVVVVAVILNFCARKLIRNFCQKIANGTTAISRHRFSAAGEDDEQKIAAEVEARTAATTAQRRAQRAHTVGSMLSSLATIVIAVIAALYVLQELGFNPAPILASAGVAGVAVGFGAQSLVKDYLSGFFLVVEDQYGIGDSVDLGEAIGLVEEVGLRTTKVRGVDGTLWHVRNGEILRVGNQSQGWARAVMDIPLPYNASQKLIDDIIHSAIANLRTSKSIGPDLIGEPEVLGVQELTGTSMTIRTLIKTRPNMQWAVARAFRAEIKRQLDRRGIAIALPEQSVIRTMPDPVQANSTDSSKPATHDGADGAQSAEK